MHNISIDEMSSAAPLNSAPMDSPASPSAPPESGVPSTGRWWRTWWRNLSPTRQDRFAALAPLASVLMFLAAIVASFWYLRTEEVDREKEALKRDVEYAQQRVRLRLLERQEQVMRIARTATSSSKPCSKRWA